MRQSQFHPHHYFSFSTGVRSTIKRPNFPPKFTFDMNEAVEESDGFEGEEVGQVLHADFERVPVVQLQVGVNRETQVLLDFLTQLVQQVLQELDARKK